VAKYFDPTRFPFADEPLIIQLEDDLHGIDALKFVADTKNSAVEQGRDQARAMTRTRGGKLWRVGARATYFILARYRKTSLSIPTIPGVNFAPQPAVAPCPKGFLAP
jgi:hypothetical protein